ncbi:hypothetical protein J6590_053461 [Homalodisca vitripennis]|nr:hypothetical protein J6590_053461 [Homalodisca vitripennis]
MFEGESTGTADPSPSDCRNVDGYHFPNFYSSSSNHRLDITLLRLQRHCLVPRRRHPGCESTHCEGK